ncbi:MAG: lytic transglycosylase domain-containing protein [Calditrichaeota bacterium]|nr:lytic transglycosylase domain-containing protein [Calditrichota bacterium]
MIHLIMQNSLTKTLIVVTILMFVFITSVSFSYHYYSKSETSKKMENLEQTASQIQSVLDMKSREQHNIQKIIAIINIYNQDMSSELKHKIAREINKMCLKYTNLNVDLICATITHESALSWDPKVVSPVGAMGLMQIMPETGIKLAAEEGTKWTSAEDILFDPIINIRLGCRYLSQLIQEYEIDGGLAAYNGGEKRAKLWLEKRNDKSDFTLLWEETQFYVPSILKLYAQFQNQKSVF